MGKTHSKPLAAPHGRGTAWARHAMCESAFISPMLRTLLPLHILVTRGRNGRSLGTFVTVHFGPNEEDGRSVSE